MKKTTAAALVAGLAVLGAAPAFAAHDGNPSAKVESYSYSLDAIQSGVPGTDATGTTRIKALPNGKATPPPQQPNGSINGARH